MILVRYILVKSFRVNIQRRRRWRNSLSVSYDNSPRRFVRMRSLIIFLFLIFNFSNSYAHHKIYSPKVEEGRQSLEWRGHFGFDDRNIYNKGHHHVFETEYSWTDFWQSELELHVSDKSETPLDWEKTEFQNQVQIFDQDHSNHLV